MEIIIEKDNASEYIAEIHKILWRQILRKSYPFYLGLLVLGLVFLFPGIHEGRDSTTSSYEYFDKANKIETTTNIYNYHISFGLGVAFILVFLFFVLIHFIEKKRFFKSINKFCYKHNQSNNNYVFKITNASISYQDFEYKKEENWNAFSLYKIEQEYLFLFRDNYFNSSTIPLKGLNSNELEDLLKIVQSRLLKKK